MNKEEIEELKEFTIDLTDIDEIALGLEICSKKSNMVIQEFIDTIVQLQQENQSLEKENKKLKENYERTYNENRALIEKDYITDTNLIYENYILSRAINKAIEYIKNNSLYEEEYDYDYEENSYLSGIDDETAKKDLLKILRGDVNE